MSVDNKILIYQWLLVIISSLAMVLISPKSKTVGDFFRGSKSDKAPGFILLTSSLVISWLFAKSIANAADLGLAFGIVGGFAYATYYLSFFVCGIIVFRMRTKANIKSIPSFVEGKFGKKALMFFSVLIGIRLMNEVWSNSMVIGSYFGLPGSYMYYLAILVFTLLTMWYTLKGGLRSSLLTDLIQMILFAVLLTAILALILPSPEINTQAIVTSGTWSWSGGLNLLLVALLQIFSYPFHDSVMTDRGFIADTSTTLRSFIAAGFIGVCSIVLFSLVGVYGFLTGLEGAATVVVAKQFGVIMMLLMNFIMITSAASTLDSAFNSFAKLWVIDLKMVKLPTVSAGRWAIIAITVVGTIPVFLGAEILSATTVSGTMVLGLAPVFLFWNDKAGKFSFYFAVSTGLVFGLCYAFGLQLPTLTEGKYDQLLVYNIFGFFAVFIAYFAGSLVDKYEL